MGTLQAKNEMVIAAPISSIWNVITDIETLHKVNPGVISAKGRMNTLYDTRTCEIDNKGRKGTMVEKLVELVPNQKTVWTIESDTMGMSKMLRDTKFCFELQKLGDEKTRVISATYYTPANIVAKLMNTLMMKKMIGNAQQQILENIKALTEKPQ
ncbi:MAG: SRPBCC family protein [Bacteroidetes bacterium]|nr:SRPBCC family protein [Bacteroidota bacterium]